MVSTFYYYQQRQNSQVHAKDAKTASDLLASIIDWKEYLESTDMDEILKEQLYSLHASELYHGVLAYIYLFDDKKEKKEMLKRASCVTECLEYNKSLECRLIRASLKLLGIRVTCGLLGMLKKYRINKK